MQPMDFIVLITIATIIAGEQLKGFIELAATATTTTLASMGGSSSLVIRADSVLTTIVHLVTRITVVTIAD
jgi:hypothetical protein